MEFCKTCEKCHLRTTEKISDIAPITPVLRPALHFVVINNEVIGAIDPPS